jgi:hypothetical protein
VWAFAGWSAFCLSAMIASVLLIVVPSVVRKGSEGVENRWVQLLAWAECSLFLIGGLCLVMHALLYLSPLSQWL